MRIIRTIQGDSNYLMAARFTADGQWLVTAGMNGHLHLRAAPDWRRVRPVHGHGKSVNALVMNRAENRLATGSSDCRVFIWSFPEFELLHQMQDRKQVVSGLGAAHSGAHFAACAYGGRVALWDFQGNPVTDFKASARNLSAVAFAPDDSALLTGGLGGQLTLWSLPEGQAVGSIEAHDVALSYCRYLPEAGQVLTLGYDGFLKLWDPARWELVRATRLHDDRITGFSVDLERQRALVLTHGLIRLFDLAQWRVADELAVDSRVLPCGAFAPDGRTALAAAADGRIRILDLAS